MPQYTYRCAKCHRVQVLIRKMADRDDAESCDAHASNQPPSERDAPSPVVLCGGALTRDEIDTAASMPYAWRP